MEILRSKTRKINTKLSIAADYRKRKRETVKQFTETHTHTHAIMRNEKYEKKNYIAYLVG